MVKSVSYKRCRSIRLSASLFVLCLLACGGDEESGTSSEAANDNRNVATPQALYTEPSTPPAVKAEAVHGLEIPSMATGNVNAFIVHTLPDGTLNYCAGYNTELRISAWTAYKWYSNFSSNYIDRNWNRNRWQQGETFNGYGGSGDPFQPDPVLPDNIRARYSDYSIRGYQRGHLLGSADRLNSKEANGQTFYLSNIHPQMSGFNDQGIWLNLESFIRDNYDRSDFRDTLYVVKGGTISEGKYKMLGSGRQVACPDYYYMAILAYAKRHEKSNGGYFAIAFWMEHKMNSEAVSSKYAINIDELENRTGIDFFCNLPDDIEAAVESRFYKEDWRLK